MSSQLEMVILEDLVSSSHQYRKFMELFDFVVIEEILLSCEKESSYKGYGICRLFKCIILQFMEDLSDRELERFLQENNAAKWFCDFSLTEVTPNFSVFCRLRKRIGTKRLSKIFSILRDQMRSKGWMSEVFTFVDASHLISKAKLWQERDKAIKLKYDKLNNDNISEVSTDKQARIGCKGKDKFWYGFKKHVSVDIQSGLINKVSVTPANVTDAQGFGHVCHNSGAVYADKGYCLNPAKQVAQRKNIHLAAIKRNNMAGKNRDFDRWLTFIRSPYERVFSKHNRHVRYVGIAKNQFAEFMKAICFNMRRILVLQSDNMTC